MDTKQFEAEFDNLLKQDVEQTLSLITGMFVGLMLEYMRHRGFDPVEPHKDIYIEGTENQRAITIHAAAPNEGKEKAKNKLAALIANEALRKLKEQGLDCVSGGYHDARSDIHTAILHAVKNNIGLNKFEVACTEFLRGCSCADYKKQEECKECLTAFCNKIRSLGPTV